MKIAAAIALAAAVTTFSTARADDPVTPSPAADSVSVADSSVSAPPVQVSRSARVYSTRRSATQSRSAFGRLIQLERRKNAWLRRTFLGR